MLATSSGQAAELAVLVHGIADPVNARIVADSLVGSVNHDNLKVLVHSVLVYPVRVEHTETTALAANTLLSNVLQVAGGLELGNTSIHGLTVNNTLQKYKNNTRVKWISKSAGKSPHLTPQFQVDPNKSNPAAHLPVIFYPISL